MSFSALPADPLRKKHRLVVRRERSRRPYLVFACVLVLLALAVAYLVGERRGGFLRFRTAAQIARINNALTGEAAANQKLQLRVAFLEHALALAHQSAVATRATLSRQQSELVKLHQDLAFYQGIFAPGSQDASVQIGGLQVLPTGQSREYRFQIVLVRADGKSSPPLAGTCSVTVSGERAGKALRLPLRAVSQGSDDPLRFTLRYFTNLAGTLDLPAGFTPHDVDVEVAIRGGGTVKSSFSWPAFRG